MARELYVGNLPFEVSEDELRRLFTVSGTVTSLHLITDPVSGQFKGCGYVRMASDAEAKDAIDSLDGALVGGRLITVSIARPQKPAGRPGGGAGKRPPAGGGPSGRRRK